MPYVYIHKLHIFNQVAHKYQNFQDNPFGIVFCWRGNKEVKTPSLIFLSHLQYLEDLKERENA